MYNLSARIIKFFAISTKLRWCIAHKRSCGKVMSLVEPTERRRSVYRAPALVSHPCVGSQSSGPPPSRIYVQTCFTWILLYRDLVQTCSNLFNLDLTVQLPPPRPGLFKFVYNEPWTVSKCTVAIRLKYLLVHLGIKRF